MSAGQELKQERLQARIQQTELAKAMGISQPRLAMIENSHRLTDGVIERYRAALAVLFDKFLLDMTNAGKTE